MENDKLVYVIAMQDSLNDKYVVLQKIYELTKQQEEAVSAEETDIDDFERILDEKEKLIERMQSLDQGFERLYAKMKTFLENNKQELKPRILEMQNILRQITDLGVKIQALERKNKQRFEQIVIQKKQQIQEFHKNNKTANLYSQHMANQHQEWQTYFLDKKK